MISLSSSLLLVSAHFYSVHPDCCPPVAAASRIIPSNLSLTTVQTCINASDEQRKWKTYSQWYFTGRNPYSGGEMSLVAEHWWALRWELDYSAGMSSFSYFHCHECPWCNVGLAGRLREKDPSVVWDYFKADTAQDVTCLERLRGRQDYGEEGTYMWEWVVEANFSKQCVLSSSRP